MTIYLRAIDIVQLTNEYLNGNYTTLDYTSRRIESKPVPVITKSSGIRSFIPVGYYLRPGNSFGKIEHNQAARCMYCLMETTSETAVGIPLAKESGLHIEETYQVKAMYHCLDIFCSYNCLLAELRRRLLTRESIYLNSITYLAEIYEMSTGKSFSSLKPSSDQRVLKVFNGWMDYPEYHQNTSFAAKPANIHFLTVTQQIEKDA